MSFDLKIVMRQMLGAFVLLFPSLNFASFVPFDIPAHGYIGGSLGASEDRIENRNPTIVYFDGLLKDEYPLRGLTATRGIVSLNGGVEFECQRAYVPAIAVGLGLYNNLTEYRFDGVVVETALGDLPSTLYNYNYNITSTRLMLEGLFTWRMNAFSAFASVGIGVAWSRLYGYEETPVDDTGFVPVPPFRSNTNSNFAYQLGVGVSYNFNICDGNDFLHERISLGYQYVDMGNTEFGTRGFEYPHALDIGRLTANEIYLAYTHLF